MKLERVPLVLVIGAMLLQGTALASEASSAPQGAISQSSEKSAGQHSHDARDGKDQARQSAANENQEHSGDGTRTATKRRPGVSHSKPIPSHQPRPAKKPTTNGPRTDAPGSVAAPAQTGSKEAIGLRREAASHRNATTPAATVGVNGRQFKNSRDAGAHLAVSGGPLTSPRGTAAVNGSNMKRKP